MAPDTLIAPNVLAVIKNTLAILSPVNNINIDDNDKPIRVANIIKQVCTPVTDIDINLLLI